MKWWGWGRDDVAFSHEGQPELGPFIKRYLELDIEQIVERPPPFESLSVPEPALPSALQMELEAALGEQHVSTDELDRVVHARGKSLSDLVRQRRGDFRRLPDVVVRPGGEDEVAAILDAALAADAVVIPFGGGTSISGSLEPPADEDRPVISVDLDRLDRVLEIDPISRVSRRASTGPSSSGSSGSVAGPSGTSPTRSPTRPWAAGSRRARRGCSRTATATSPI
jgi:alkyldihydroxyacetonephosphate synthase